MLGKIGRWTAGRVQGSKGVQKYDNWMGNNPWAGQALRIGDAAIGNAIAGPFGALATSMIGGKYNPGGNGNRTGGSSQLDRLNKTGMSELDELRKRWQNPQGDPAVDGIDFNDPGAALADRAANATWANDPGFDPTIQDDALADFRNTRFNSTIANDPASGFDERFSSMYDPGIDGPDALDDMRGAYDGMMSLGRDGGGAQAGMASAGTASVDLSALDNFDATAAFERYSTGANNRFMSSLQSGLDGLRNSAAGGNRLNTGFFDLDSGKLGRDLRQDAANDISAAALNTNAQNLQARTSAAGFRTNMASTNASNQTQASIANARGQTDVNLANADRRLTALQSADRSAQARAGIQRDDRGFKADRFDVQTGNLQDLAKLRRGDRDFEADRFDAQGKRDLAVAGVQRDDRGFAYKAQQDGINRSDDRVRNDRTTYLDAAAAKTKGWMASNDTRMSVGDFNQRRKEFDQNSYLDWLAGMSDRAQGADNARNQSKAQSQTGWAQVAGQVAGYGLDYLSRRGSRGGSGGMGNPVSRDFTQSRLA
jgi:hypothetical protein